jgi:hypothetical protein
LKRPTTGAQCFANVGAIAERNRRHSGRTERDAPTGGTEDGHVTEDAAIKAIPFHQVLGARESVFEFVVGDERQDVVDEFDRRSDVVLIRRGKLLDANERIAFYAIV